MMHVLGTKPNETKPYIEKYQQLKGTLFLNILTQSTKFGFIGNDALMPLFNGTLLQQLDDEDVEHILYSKDVVSGLKRIILSSKNMERFTNLNDNAVDLIKYMFNEKLIQDCTPRNESEFICFNAMRFTQKSMKCFWFESFPNIIHVNKLGVYLNRLRTDMKKLATDEKSTNTNTEQLLILCDKELKLLCDAEDSLGNIVYHINKYGLYTALNNTADAIRSERLEFSSLSESVHRDFLIKTGKVDVIIIRREEMLRKWGLVLDDKEMYAYFYECITRMENSISSQSNATPPQSRIEPIADNDYYEIEVLAESETSTNVNNNTLQHGELLTNQESQNRRMYDDMIESENINDVFFNAMNGVDNYPISYNDFYTRDLDIYDTGSGDNVSIPTETDDSLENELFGDSNLDVLERSADINHAEFGFISAKVNSSTQAKEELARLNTLKKTPLFAENKDSNGIHHNFKYKTDIGYISRLTGYHISLDNIFGMINNIQEQECVQYTMYLNDILAKKFLFNSSLTPTDIPGVSSEYTKYDTSLLCELAFMPLIEAGIFSAFSRNKAFFSAMRKIRMNFGELLENLTNDGFHQQIVYLGSTVRVIHSKDLKLIALPEKYSQKAFLVNEKGFLDAVASKNDKAIQAHLHTMFTFIKERLCLVFYAAIKFRLLGKEVKHPSWFATQWDSPLEIRCMLMVGLLLRDVELEQQPFSFWNRYLGYRRDYNIRGKLNIGILPTERISIKDKEGGVLEKIDFIDNKIALVYKMKLLQYTYEFNKCDKMEQLEYVRRTFQFFHIKQESLNVYNGQYKNIEDSLLEEIFDLAVKDYKLLEIMRFNPFALLKSFKPPYISIKKHELIACIDLDAVLDNVHYPKRNNSAISKRVISTVQKARSKIIDSLFE